MTGKRIGLVIGNNYPNSSNELKFAVADAKKMQGILENRDLCGFDEVIYLENGTSKDASTTVEKILKKANNDFVFIYYSGHGKKDFEGNLCLLFNDTEEDCLLTTSLTFDFVNKCLNYPSKKSVVIVLDCCYSGVAGFGGRDADTDVIEDLKRYSGTGKVILTSTGSFGSPTAREDEKLGHGIFTNYLIEGLEKGNADQNGDGLITIDEMYDYAYKKTIENCTQFPKREGRMEGTFIIGRNPQKIRENECKLKTDKLLTFVDQLPPRIFDESLTILRKNYNEPFSMDKTEIGIYQKLESFLEGELSVESYSTILMHIKGCCVNAPVSKTEDLINVSKPAALSIAVINDTSGEASILPTSSSPSTEPILRVKDEIVNRGQKEIKLINQKDSYYDQIGDCLFLNEEKKIEEAFFGDNPTETKEKEFEINHNKLIDIVYNEDMPPKSYDESLIILKKVYENPSSLTGTDKMILCFLKNLLDGNISVDTYVMTAQRIKTKEKKYPSLPNEQKISAELDTKILQAQLLEKETPIRVQSEISQTSKLFKSLFTDMEFVFIPAGEFTMGSPSEEKGRYDNESPLHKVEIKKPFYMGKYPVTQRRWEKVMGSNPSRFKDDNRPVECVSWYDVQEFIKKLNEIENTDKYRLPSEAEWEYACRAGTTTRFSFGEDESKLSDYAWYKRNSDDQTHPIGQKEPNFWGLYDMHGSLWEWVQDSSHDSYNGANSDGSAWEEGYDSLRILRGGSWNTHAGLCRSAVRFGYFPDNRNYHLGVRLLREI